MFEDNPVSGVIFLLVILLNSRFSALFAALGSAIGILVALVLGGSGVAIYHGLYGFNPVLCDSPPLPDAENPRPSRRGALSHLHAPGTGVPSGPRGLLPVEDGRGAIDASSIIRRQAWQPLPRCAPRAGSML